MNSYTALERPTLLSGAKDGQGSGAAPGSAWLMPIRNHEITNSRLRKYLLKNIARRLLFAN